MPATGAGSTKITVAAIAIVDTAPLYLGKAKGFFTEQNLDITVQSVCAGDLVRHSGLPRDSNVAAMVLTELAPGPPVELGAQDCGRVSS